MKRLGIRTALGVGATTFMAGMCVWACRLTPQISDDAMYLPLALTGFGAGWQIGPVSILINSQTSNLLTGEGMELYLCQRQLGGSWGIAILAILVDRQRSFWSGRLGERINEYNPLSQDAFRHGANLLQSAGLPYSQADAGAVGLLHARLVLQSVVNAFVDTFAYQAAIGALALFLAVFFARGRALKAGIHWVVQMTR
jgi:DHA2 family multidrug resistance protein